MLLRRPLNVILLAERHYAAVLLKKQTSRLLGREMPDYCGGRGDDLENRSKRVRSMVLAMRLGFSAHGIKFSCSGPYSTSPATLSRS
jgi:hypothetical protein